MKNMLQSRMLLLIVVVLLLSIVLPTNLMLGLLLCVAIVMIANRPRPPKAGFPDDED